jgi:hypothetical protein
MRERRFQCRPGWDRWNLDRRQVNAAAITGQNRPNSGNLGLL